MRILIVVFAVWPVCSLGISDDKKGTTDQRGITRSNSVAKTIPSVPQVAIQHLLNNNYVAALPYYRQAVKDDPNNADHHNSLASILLAAGHEEESIAEFREAVRLDPDKAEFHRDLAAGLAMSGESEHAIVEMNHAIRLSPEQYEYYLDVGLIYLARRQYTEAIQNLSSSLSKKETTKARLARAMAFYMSGQQAAAVADCDIVLKDDPNNHQAYACRGYANLRRGEYDAAKRDAKQALDRLDSKTSKDVVGMAHMILGGVCLMRDDADVAIQHLSKSLEVDSKHPLTLIFRAFAYLNMGDSNRAIEDLNATIQTAESPQQLDFSLNGFGWQAYKFRGLLNLCFKKDSFASVQDFTKAIELNDKDADCYALRGWAYSELGQWKESLDDLNHSLDLAPGHLMGTVKLVHVLTACPEDELRDGQRALAMAQEACKATKWNNLDQIQGLAAAYSETGDFLSAMFFQSKVVEWGAKPQQRVPYKIEVWWNSKFSLDLRVEKNDAIALLNLYVKRKPYRDRFNQEDAAVSLVPVVPGENPIR